VRAVAPKMIARGHGRIINVTGGGSNVPLPFGSGYASSKAAVTRFTECLGLELRERNVAVFALAPGLVRTAMGTHQLESEEGRKWLPYVARQFQRGEDYPPESSAELAVQLASGRFDALTGRSFYVWDNLDDLEARQAEVLEKELQVLRMRFLSDQPADPS